MSVMNQQCKVRRVFVEKKDEYNVEAMSFFKDIKENLRIKGLKKVRILNRYDVQGLEDHEYDRARQVILSEPPVDRVYDEVLEFEQGSRVFAIEFLPGQYDQRSDFASQCMQILTTGHRPVVRVAKVYILYGEISDEDFNSIKTYCINPVECREALLDKPETLEEKVELPGPVGRLDGFISMTREDMEELLKSMGLAMSIEDLAFCQQYFKETEKRDPTITEIRVLDTYWSDHCRHTTFNTIIDDVTIEQGRYAGIIEKAYEEYRKSRDFVYKDEKKEICLMDIATIGMKESRKKGMLDDLEVSDEVNASSISIDAVIDGKKEEWLLMFKNETHNHPTEIEPFGGAATCLGGAIRDPLSGRAYVFQAMRVTGSGDPRTPTEETLRGKLPQRTITTVAAKGYSSYGNEVGVPTGLVEEIYDEGYVAKRMELGAIIGAAPRKNVYRGKPEPGDVIILLGGRTGRDGCGGATGSSKEHTEESLLKCGAEVQKGNPVIERKILRLFRKPEVSRLIKKCNDFGAGGVSVAIGELADGLEINLDLVPKKYEGLDGTELAISESQERMAVMVDASNAELFIREAEKENLEATPVATVSGSRRLRMHWNGQTIVDISRDFLNTNGVRRHAKVAVKSPACQGYFEGKADSTAGASGIRELWLERLGSLSECSRKGLVEMFDSTIGAGTLLMPFGGAFQLTPQEGMAAKLPVLEGETNTGTLMSFGYNPAIARWSPFHGAVYAVVEAVSRIAAMGGDYKKVRLTLQEYFEGLRNDPARWGKPFSALLGAFYAQKMLGIPAIGGKDSMSGSFGDLDVPPTLVAFAVVPVDITKVVSAEFKNAGSTVVLLNANRDQYGLPDFDSLKACYGRLYNLSQQGRILSMCSVKDGGVSPTVSKMCFGNMIGFEFSGDVDTKTLFEPGYGSFVIEIGKGENADEMFNGLNFIVLGKTTAEAVIKISGTGIGLAEAIKAWTEPLESVFPSVPVAGVSAEIPVKLPETAYVMKSRPYRGVRHAAPRVFIPVMPGTNCEYDTARCFEKAGAVTDVMVMKNLSAKDIEDSIKRIADGIRNSQIIAFPGGFSGGDEPDGSGKFIAAVFRNPYVAEETMKLLKERDGLIIGICNGFQALIKLGLVPYGEIREQNAESPTLTFNTLGRHVSTMVRTKVVSKLSPWLSKASIGEIHTVPVSHGEGRFVSNKEQLELLIKNGQIATQYVDPDGNPTYDTRYNPNGSLLAIEGITSPDGRVFGKMAHSERTGKNLSRNVPGKDQLLIFEAGVEYFK